MPRNTAPFSWDIARARFNAPLLVPHFHCPVSMSRCNAPFHGPAHRASTLTRISAAQQCPLPNSQRLNSCHRVSMWRACRLARHGGMGPRLLDCSDDGPNYHLPTCTTQTAKPCTAPASALRQSQNSTHHAQPFTTAKLAPDNNLPRKMGRHECPQNFRRDCPKGGSARILLSGTDSHGNARNK
eukprot:3228890-Rhodomonas_salina.1